MNALDGPVMDQPARGMPPTTTPGIAASHDAGADASTPAACPLCGHGPVTTAGLSARASERGLTPREVDVLRLIAGGLSNTEIAAELWISINSVKSYIRSAYRRLDVNTRPQAILWSLGGERGEEASWVSVAGRRQAG